MSLLEQAMESYTILDRTTAGDGYGGYVTRWKEGATIQGALVQNQSIEAQKAMAMGVTSVYTFTTPRAVNLRYHDVLRKDSDGRIFRVTSNGDDKKTPQSASLDMRQVTVESWELPDGDISNE